MPLARASELDRLLHCAGSAVLPRVRDGAGVAAAYGTTVHHWAETGEILANNHGRLLARKIEAHKVSREGLWPAEGEHEVPLAYNVVNGEVRRYVPPSPLPPGFTAKSHAAAWKEAFGDEWVTGSLDYASELVDTYWVDDLKTGRLPTWEAHEAQQTFYCLAWSKAKYGELRTGRSTLTIWPRYPLSVAPYRVGHTVTTHDLGGFELRLQKLRTQILHMRLTPENLNANLQPSNRCKWCPSHNACPAVSDSSNVIDTTNLE